MKFTTLLGLLAGTLTTIAFVPQVIKAWRTKHTHDISLGMFVIFCMGVFLWLMYGILIKNFPITVNNVITLVLTAIILVLKLKYK